MIFTSQKVFVTLSSRFYSKINPKPPWKILFYGADDFSVISLKALLEEYRKGHLISRLEVCTTLKKMKNAVHVLAEREELVLKQWPFPSALEENNFDTGIVVSFGHLIPDKLIKSFPLGMINVHASLLPSWRGAAPMVHCIANGDSQTGVTIMKIRPHKFDTGEIIQQKSVSIGDHICLPELHGILGNLGALALIECLRDLPNKLQMAKQQPNINVSYAPKPDKSFAFIKWRNMSSVQIYNLGRALDSFMPVTAQWKGEIIKLYNIGTSDEPTTMDPGYVTFDSELDVLKVACIDKNIVTIKNVKVFQKKLISATDFYNGYLGKTPENQRYFT